MRPPPLETSPAEEITDGLFSCAKQDDELLTHNITMHVFNTFMAVSFVGLKIWDWIRQIRLEMKVQIKIMTFAI